jgi:hypothetical protein
MNKGELRIWFSSPGCAWKIEVRLGVDGLCAMSFKRRYASGQKPHGSLVMRRGAAVLRTCSKKSTCSKKKAVGRIRRQTHLDASSKLAEEKR